MSIESLRNAGQVLRDVWGYDSCVLIHSGGDVITGKKIMEGERTEASAGAMRSLEAMNDLCNGSGCRHKALVEHFGQPFVKDNNCNGAMANQN